MYNGKHILLVYIEHFLLSVTAEALRANIGSKSAISPHWLVYPKFALEVVAPTNCSSQKTRLNGLSYGIKIWTDLCYVFSQSTRVTDRQTAFSSLDRICIPCSAVKMVQDRM